MSGTDIASRAAQLGRLGFDVFPLKVWSKHPATPNGFKDASGDPVTIATWWSRMPDNNVAIRTGMYGAQCLVVVDLDEHTPGVSGNDAWAELCAEHDYRPDTVECLTPSGGRHVYYWTHAEIRNSAGANMPAGIDVRGEGGYVVAPPSMLATDGVYAWEASSDPTEGVAIATMPQWLQDRLTAAPPAQEARRTVDAPARLAAGGPRPGDLWAAATPWPDLLQPDGATYLGTRSSPLGTYEVWARPRCVADHGELHIGATLYYGGSDVLKVHTSAWPGLTEGDTYTKLGYIAALRFSGDHSAAARWCVEQGHRAPISTPSPSVGAAPPVPIEQPSDRAPSASFITGGAFIFDTDHTVAPRWGSGDEVLMARGETLMICGPPGVGKTTLVNQLVRGAVGLQLEVLGWPVTALEPGRRVLYLALDRPRQISRAMARNFDRAERARLDERLIVWRKPLPYKIDKRPDVLLQLAAEAGAGMVIVDSLKDAASKFTDDESGAGINDAFQQCIAAGIDVVVLHHQRKGQDGRKPTKLDDVYGSAFITAGAGSVLLLWGEAGDPIVELSHLKPPAEKIGPVKVEHDHQTGRSRLVGQIDVVQFARNFTGGATRADLARSTTSQANPADKDLKSAGRLLDNGVKRGVLRKVDGEKGGPDGATPARYFVVGES